MTRVFLGLLSYLEFGICLLLWTPLLGVVRLCHPRDLRRRGRWMRHFGRVTARLSPLWRFSVEGRPPADVGTAACVVVANHESSADPFLLSTLPWDMRWVAKEDLFRTPLLGRLLRWGGDIPLRRGDRASVRQMMTAARETLAGGLPVMLFPEGTRSADGSLGHFKDGAFQLAVEAGVPILPLAIEGTRACRPKGSLWFGAAAARVRVLAPIATTGLSAADVPSLRELARTRIAEALVLMRSAPRVGARAPVTAWTAGPGAAPRVTPPECTTSTHH